MLDYLLSLGAKIEAGDADKNTALSVAVKYAREENIEVLISRGASLDKYINGSSFLAYALTSRLFSMSLSCSTLQLLLRHGANIYNTKYIVCDPSPAFELIQNWPIYMLFYCLSRRCDFVPVEMLDMLAEMAKFEIEIIRNPFL